MKIGIITVHRAYNYGSVLQCYALQEYLRKAGHEVWVIDYRQRWTEAVYKPFSWYYIWQFVKRRDIHTIVAYWRCRKEKRYNLKHSKPIFSSFIKRLHLTKPCRKKVPAGFDIYLIGSDQLWSFQCVGGEDKIYTGNFKHPSGSRIIGYSMSAGVDSLLKWGTDGLKRVIGNFDDISLREVENAKIIKNLTGITLPVTVDPVLLTDSSMWDSMINSDWQHKNYIVIYQARIVSGRPNYLCKKAAELAQQCHCEVIDLSNKRYAVEDFISSIKYARYVMTTSFHAAVFAMLMETPCYAIRLGDGLDVRYVDLLSKVGLEQELVDLDFRPIPFEVDFNTVKKRLANYQQASQDYLRKSLII